MFRFNKFMVYLILCLIYSFYIDYIHALKNPLNAFSNNQGKSWKSTKFIHSPLKKHSIQFIKSIYSNSYSKLFNDFNEDVNNDDNVKRDYLEEFSYPVLPRNKYPESMTDEEVLMALEKERIIDNDRWQSQNFRQKHGGQWSGSFEVLTPFQQESSRYMRRAAIGAISTRIEASEPSFEGVNITFTESYNISKVLIENSLTKSLRDSQILKPTREFYPTTSFRSKFGNQQVGEGFTLGQTIVDANTAAVRAYIAEIAIREGPVRSRVRYIYASDYNDDVTVFQSSDEKVFDLKLIACVVIREAQEETCTPSDLSLVLNNTPGTNIYDPQEVGDEYVEVRQYGRLSLYFPIGVSVNRRTVLTAQWQGSQLLFQIDRKFSTLIDSAITTMELTEIRPQDASKFPAR